MRTEFIRLFYTDNTTLNVGTAGDVIATDDIGGVKFQRVKLIHGPDGTNAGDISQQNPLTRYNARQHSSRKHYRSRLWLLLLPLKMASC
jgi:hypothetical protein